MNAAQLRTLDAMGLTVWEPRGSAPHSPIQQRTERADSSDSHAPLPGVEVYPGSNPVALVLVVAPRPFRVTMKTEDGVMMARILEAMKARKGAFCVRHVMAKALSEPFSTSQGLKFGPWCP